MGQSRGRSELYRPHLKYVASMPATARGHRSFAIQVSRFGSLKISFDTMQRSKEKKQSITSGRQIRRRRRLKRPNKSSQAQIVGSMTSIIQDLAKRLGLSPQQLVQLMGLTPASLLPDLLSAKDTASFLGVSTKTLANWRVKGVPSLSYSKVGSCVFYSRAVPTPIFCAPGVTPRGDRMRMSIIFCGASIQPCDIITCPRVAPFASHATKDMVGRVAFKLRSR